MDPVQALAQLGGVAPIGAWRAVVRRAAARDALAYGRVVRLPRHQVALPSLEESRRAAAALGGTVSHLSAALAHGWKVKDPPPRPVVTVPRNRRLPDPLPDADRHWADLPLEQQESGRTGPVQTVVDCARTYPFDVALCVADSALRAGVARADLLAAADRSPRTGRSRAVRVVREASADAANPFESVLRAIALDVPGLGVRPQGWIGTAGRVDLVDDRLLVAIEADSWEHHGSREAFKHDVRRYAEFARLGWVVVRYLHEDVMRRPAWVHAQLAEVAAVRARQLL